MRFAFHSLTLRVATASGPHWNKALAFFASPLLLNIKVYSEGAGYLRFNSSGTLSSFAF